MPDWAEDPIESAIRDFCYGGGRGIPRSVFLGRTVEPDEPQWLPEDTEAAIEWQLYQNSLCSGCRRPRQESFAVGMDDHYDVTELQCHACAARERRAWNTRPNAGESPSFGRFFVVKPEAPNADMEDTG